MLFRSLLLYLNDETLSSDWCRCVKMIIVYEFPCLMIDTRHEVEEARRYGIPIIVLVDTDKQLAREVIDKYMELGFSWLFDEQARWFNPSPLFVTFVSFRSYHI